MAGVCVSSLGKQVEPASTSQRCALQPEDVQFAALLQMVAMAIAPQPSCQLAAVAAPSSPRPCSQEVQAADTAGYQRRMEVLSTRVCGMDGRELSPEACELQDELQNAMTRDEAAGQAPGCSPGSDWPNSKVKEPPRRTPPGYTYIPGSARPFDFHRAPDYRPAAQKESGESSFHGEQETHVPLTSPTSGTSGASGTSGTFMKALLTIQEPDRVSGAGAAALDRQSSVQELITGGTGKSHNGFRIERVSIAPQVPAATGDQALAFSGNHGELAGPRKSEEPAIPESNTLPTAEDLADRGRDTVKRAGEALAGVPVETVHDLPDHPGPAAAGDRVQGSPSITAPARDAETAESWLVRAGRAVYEPHEPAGPAAVNLRLELEPPHLGKLTVTLSTRGDDVSVRFSVPSQEVRQALMDTSLDLARALSQQGLVLSSFLVDARRGGNSGHMYDGLPGYDKTSRKAPGTSHASEEVFWWQDRARGISVLDYFA